MMRLIFACAMFSLSILAADDTIHLSGVENNAQLDALTFTSTQKWGQKYLDRSKNKTQFLPADWRKKFAVPAPPANSSPRTLAELAYLEKLVSKRAAHITQIRSEVLAANYRWGSHTYKGLTKSKKLPHTGKLLLAAYDDLAIAVFVFKQHFNRVRPSILSKKIGKDIGTSIDIPSHPAYPSGHATGAFTLAYILQELDPENADIYRKDALRIAQNREIAGLHYPSDTEAGRLLARQIVDTLLANPEFKKLLKAARSEW